LRVVRKIVKGGGNVLREILRMDSTVLTILGGREQNIPLYRKIQDRKHGVKTKEEEGNRRILKTIGINIKDKSLTTQG